MKLHVMLEPQPEGGFTATCIEIPGAISQGESVEEALDNIADAVREIVRFRLEDAEASVRAHNGLIETVDLDAQAPT